jgi:curved DNA-binding protein CbpA
VRYDPFAELGLPALAELTDDDVHAAWRRIAAATHPDREDGGDAARFSAAAAAYVVLKTSFGRGEALADLGGSARRGCRRRNGSTQDPWLLWNPRLPWPVRLPWYSQRRGAHRLHAAAPSARFRHAGDTRPGHGGATRIRVAGGKGTRHAGGKGTRHAADSGFRQTVSAIFRQACRAGFAQAGYARGRLAGYARGRLAGYVTVDRRLARPVGAAALGAAAAIAVVGWTPATIGLVAGALTVTAWGLWRRAWRDR